MQLLMLDRVTGALSVCVRGGKAGLRLISNEVIPDRQRHRSWVLVVMKGDLIS